MSDQPLYSLEDARVMLAKQECARWGHDIAQIESDNGIVLIFCERCPQRWLPEKVEET